jgi:hypothetical protein
METDIRKALEHVRELVRLLSPYTPTKYDDYLIKLLDFVLGPATIQAQAVNIPWEQLVQVLLPLILDLLKKWLESVAVGGAKPSVAYDPATEKRCN